jgi:hypothetical protein
MSVCICALGIQHALRMGHIVICGLPDNTVFYTLSHKRRDLKKKVIGHKIVFNFSTNFA